MAERRKGIVKWFSAKKGFGFITNDDEQDVFVHFSNITLEGFRKLDAGDEVEYTLSNSDSEKGPEALDVKIIVKDRRY